MKYLLSIFILICFCNVGKKAHWRFIDGKWFANTYYVRTDGNDANSGTSNTAGGAFRTVYKACTVATNGDLISVQSGTFTETTQLPFAVGVTMRGVDTANTIIKSTLTGQFNPILLGSSTPGTVGNNEIYNIKFDGDSVNGQGLKFQGRGYVNIHNCYFRKYQSRGVIISGRQDDNSGPPSVYADSVKFQYNRMEDCAEYDRVRDAGYGCLNIGGLVNFQVTNNTIINNYRPDGYNGYPIKNYNDGFLYGGKINYNYLQKKPLAAPNGTYNWDFNIELSSQGGIEIAYNTIVDGGIDFNRLKYAGYAYGTWIHHNTAYIQTLSSYVESFVTCDYAGEGIIINNNYANKYTQGVLMTPRDGDSLRGVQIYSNLFDSINGQKAIDLQATTTANYKVDSIYIWNNTLLGVPSNPPFYFINYPFQTTGSNGTSYFVNNNLGYFTYGIQMQTTLPFTAFYFRGNNVYSFTDTFNIGTNPTLFVHNSNIGVTPTYGALKVPTSGSALETSGVIYSSPFTSYAYTGYAINDVTPPTVSSVTPTNGSTNQSTGARPTATFSETLDAATVNTSTVLMKIGSTPVSISVALSANVITITPISTLSNSTTYTITLVSGSSGIKDLAGNALATNYSWSFTTAATPYYSPIFTTNGYRIIIQ